MPTLRRGYGAVRNLRCKSGAGFPPSTVWTGTVVPLQAVTCDGVNAEDAFLDGWMDSMDGIKQF